MIAQISKKIVFLSVLALFAISGQSALFGGEVIVVNDSDFDVKINASSYDVATSQGGQRVWDLGPYKAYSGTNEDEGLYGVAANYVIGYGPGDKIAKITLVNPKNGLESEPTDINLDDSTKDIIIDFARAKKKVKVNVSVSDQGQRVQGKSYPLYTITIKNQ